MPPGRCATDERVAAVRATGLGDAPDPVFVRQADLVRRLLKVPVAWVTLVLPDRQLFPGVSGLDGAPDTPSLCRRVVADGEPLIIPDTAADLPEPAWPHEEFASYAGMPLVDSGGCVLGALAAVDTVPRLWNADDREILQDLAAACSTELQLRIQIGRTRAATADAESARHAAEVQRQAAEQARQRSQLTSGITQAMTST
ncbi:MAG TPA: GAF domain-containing protein, partial [Mycobacteriales bacterium]|nr:GAF domain-containing protein [Mycobacteriales bacterium]